MKRTTLTLLILLAGASAPLGIRQASAQAAAPGAELDQAAFFIGNWNCTGKTFADGNTSEHATTGRAHGEKAVDGHWIHMAYDESRTTANPHPYHVAQYTGYDAAKKQYVNLVVDISGNYNIERSAGLKGDAMTFDGAYESNGHSVAMRDTFTKSGANQMMHTGTQQGSNGQWAKTDEETCGKTR